MYNIISQYENNVFNVISHVVESGNYQQINTKQPD